jgi:GAF domain-containing protein
MVVGKRVAPPPGTTIRVEVPDAGLCWTVQVGDDGRAAAVADAAAAPTTSVSLSPEDFDVLAGGRRRPEATHPLIEGDHETAQRLLGVMAVTP